MAAVAFRTLPHGEHAFRGRSSGLYYPSTLNLTILRACAGHLECARLLLAAGASLRSQCEGSPPLHLAACTGALPQRRQFAADAVQLLLSYGAEAHSR